MVPPRPDVLLNAPCAVANAFAWSDPVESGLLLGSGSLAFCLLQWGGFSVLQLICATLLSLLLVCSASSLLAWLFARLRPGQPLPSGLVPLSERLAPQGELQGEDPRLQELARLALAAANGARLAARRALYGAEPRASAVLAAVLAAGLWLGGLLGGLPLLYLAFLAPFASPFLRPPLQPILARLPASLAPTGSSPQQAHPKQS